VSAITLTGESADRLFGLSTFKILVDKFAKHAPAAYKVYQSLGRDLDGTEPDGERGLKEFLEASLLGLADAVPALVGAAQSEEGRALAGEDPETSDRWFSFVASALPYVMKYGPKVVKHASKIIGGREVVQSDGISRDLIPAALAATVIADAAPEISRAVNGAPQ
jgi:hypothetical protein